MSTQPRSKREVELELEVARGQMREVQIASQNLQLSSQLLSLQANEAKAAITRLEAEVKTFDTTGGATQGGGGPGEESGGGGGP